MWRAPIITIAFLALCVWGLEASSTFQACLQKQQGSIPDGDVQGHISALKTMFSHRRECLGSFLHSHHNDLLAAFTIILASATIFLWVATRDLVAGAERTAHKQLRAYVSLHKGGVTPATIDNGSGVFAQVELKNCGLTPAYDFTTAIRVEVIDTSLPAPFVELSPDRPGSRSILGPGVSSQLTCARAIGVNDAHGIREGTKSIYVWGHADYRDGFGKRWRFTFHCINGRPQADGWGLNPHHQGYDETRR